MAKFQDSRVPSSACSAAYAVLPSRFGRIIGPRGTTIKRLRLELGVNIKVPPRDSGLSAVTIEAPSAAMLERARVGLEREVEHPLREGVLTTIELDVPMSRHGAIIGSRGSVINALQRELVCDINLPEAVERGRSSIVSVTALSREAAHAVRARLEELLQIDRISVLSATRSHSAIAIDDVYRVHTEHPIRVALFFPTHLEMESRADGTRLDTLDVLCKWLISAKRTLDVCVFTITNSAIARALLGAHRKGVRVRIITDDEQVLSTGSKVRELGVAGIDIRTDNSRFHMHHKFALLDDAVLINGSFNWTRQAESSNNENVCVSNDGYFVEQFSDEFQRKWDQFEGQRRTK